MSVPDMTRVRSSNVYAIGYDKTERILYVQFNDGSLYRYDNVPFSIYRAFITAPSKGRFLWRSIRDRYDYEQVFDDDDDVDDEEEEE